MASKRRELLAEIDRLSRVAEEWNRRLSAVSHWDVDRPALEAARDATESVLHERSRELRRLRHVA